MELNKNKTIFFTIGVFLLLLLTLILLNLNNSANQDNLSNRNTFNIWMLADESINSGIIIDGFKNLYPRYRNTPINIEIFNSYDEYIFTLTNSFITGRSPDVFVLNNNESESIFLNRITGIDPSVINPNDFRKRYKTFFSDDLIIRNDNIEFLKGIPVGYENLGIYYNRAQVRHSDLDNLSTLNNLISDLKNKNPSIVPFGIGNGSTVDYVSDILTQFFMLESGVNSIGSLNSSSLRQGISSYLLYGDLNGINGYNSRFIELQNLKETSLYLFSRGEVHMIVGYPSMINKIKKYGYSASFLQARTFPHYFSGEGKTLVNYNYFVVNNETINSEISFDFLSYLYSDTGSNNFLSNFNYLFPALLSLESDKLEQRIHPDFNIVLKDFYKEEKYLSSFNKGVKSLYDSGIPGILDNSQYAETNFGKFREYILCRTNKIVNLDLVSNNCNK